jgi:ubiquinone/menaquinone biosynthesis C-methylase UbiE
MAWETRPENAVALELLQLQPTDRVLEIGFGHGRTLAAAARLVGESRVAGVDVSPEMVALARKRTPGSDLRLADSSHLPFADSSFEKVYAVHTVYFWKQPLEHLKEARRVLRAGGRLVLGFRPRGNPAVADFSPAVYTFRSAEEIKDLLLSAGFRSVRLERPGRPARGTVFALAAT